jgi:peroxiredoxin Q/BCP
MAQLRQDYQEFVRREAEVIVVGPEDRSAFEQYWRKEQLPFIGVPDPSHTVANTYGQQVKLLKLGRLPALILIDKTGQVCYQHYGQAMHDIPANNELLSVLDRLNQTEAPSEEKTL